MGEVVIKGKSGGKLVPVSVNDEGKLVVVASGVELKAGDIYLAVDGVEALLGDIKTGKVVKNSEFTAADISNGKITIPESARPVTYFEIVNRSNDNTLTFTIGGKSFTLNKKDVDAKGLPLLYSFGDDFPAFTEVTITGTNLDFKAIVKG